MTTKGFGRSSMSTPPARADAAACAELMGMAKGLWRRTRDVNNTYRKRYGTRVNGNPNWRVRPDGKKAKAA